MLQCGRLAYSHPNLNKHLSSLSPTQGTLLTAAFRSTTINSKDLAQDETLRSRQVKPTFTMSASTTEALTSLTTAPQIKELKSGFGVVVDGLDFAEGVTKESCRLVEELVKKVNTPPISL